MYQQNNAPEYRNGEKLDRPNQFFAQEGFLNGFNWDKNDPNSNSGIAYFGFTRNTGQGENKRKSNISFKVRVWGKDAQFIEHIHQISKEPQNSNAYYFFNLQCRVASYPRKTGRTYGPENKPVLENVMFFEGNTALLINSSTREILAQAALHNVNEEAMDDFT